MIVGIERVLVLAQRAVERQRDLHVGRQLPRQQPGALELLEPRQVGETLKPEMIEKRLGRAVGHRPARRAAAAAHPNPARLHQQVERAFAGRDAAHLFDLGARRRLVIGDDGQCFERGARQWPLVGLLAAQQETRGPSAVRNAHLSPRCTRLTPRLA